MDEEICSLNEDCIRDDTVTRLFTRVKLCILASWKYIAVHRATGQKSESTLALHHVRMYLIPSTLSKAHCRRLESMSNI